MTRVLSQCRKELAQFRRDRRTLALAFILPLAILLIYGYAIRLEVKNIPLSIQDFDHSQLSQTYVDRLFATQQFIPAPLLQDDPMVALDDGLAKAAVVIPPDFSRRLTALQPTTVQVLVDGTDVNNARVIQNGIRAATRFFMQREGLLPPQAEPLIHPRIRLWFNPGRQEALYIVPGIFGVILWVFPSMLAAIALVREIETGTVVQVYASDLSASEWLLGKALAYLIIGLGEAGLAWAVSRLLFELRFQGDPTPLLVGTPLFVGTAVAFGLLVGSRTGNQTGAVQGTAIAGFLTALLLSGFIYRLENIPFPLSLMSHIIPARYFIHLTRDAFVRGTGWSGVWYAPIAIALIGGLCFWAAVRLLRAMQFPD